MHVDPTFLVLSIVMLWVGPLLLFGTSRRAALRSGVEALVAVSVAALVLFEILPEAVHVVGPTALVAAAVGLGVPILVERRAKAASHGMRHAALGLALVAFALHAATDGLALAGAGGHAHGHGDGLGLAVALHHVPEGAAIAWLLRGRGALGLVLALAFVTLCTLAGFGLGEHVLPWVDPRASTIFQAFVGGLLLHVLLHGGAHEHRRAALPWAIAGLALAAFLPSILDTGAHAHEHHATGTTVGFLVLVLSYLGLRTFAHPSPERKAS
jgi:zinc transporter ZupT